MSAETWSPTSLRTTINAASTARSVFVAPADKLIGRDVEILATIIESPARHDVDVWTYFRDLVVKLAGGWPHSRLDELLLEHWHALHAPA